MNQHATYREASVGRPVLWRDLKLSLCALYSFPIDESLQPCPPLSPQQANDALIGMQSRNVRRKILSIGQRSRDQAAVGKHSALQTEHHAMKQSIGMGSSWLACLAMICDGLSGQTHGNNLHCVQQRETERLFCAQTLLHRLRRTKLNEAIDWEIEQPHDLPYNEALTFYQTCTYRPNLVEIYKHWLCGTFPAGALVLNEYHQSKIMTNDDEERIKGELSLLTLASIMFQSALSSSGHGRQTPFISSLGASMAVVALRLRYTVASVDRAGGPVDHCKPIVIMIAQSLAAVWNTVNQHLTTDSCLDGRKEKAISAFGVALHACLAAVPDVLLGPGGGARAKLSTDPRCIQAASRELREGGFRLAWETSHQYRQQIRALGLEASFDYQRVDFWTLSVCHQWAKVLPLPLDLASHVAGLAKNYLMTGYSECQKVALLFVISVCEAGAWTVDEVLAFNLGLSEHQLTQQPNKKRQSSRSKKHQKSLVEENATDSTIIEAKVEAQQRGEVSCLVTQLVWDGLNSLVEQVLAACGTDSNLQVDGEGPVGCLTACAVACLPHIVNNPQSLYARELFLAIVGPFRMLCEAPNKAIRGLTFEPLNILHNRVMLTLETTGAMSDELESLILEHFFESCLKLAGSCPYPVNYFDDLTMSSDEDLEIERNDVRDLLRTVTEWRDSSPSRAFAMNLIERLLNECERSVVCCRNEGRLFEETAIHAFSSLAKPLDHLMRTRLDGLTSRMKSLLLSSLNILQCTAEILIHSFDHQLSISDLLPRSRTFNLAVASLAPFLSLLCEFPDLADQVFSGVDVSIRAAAFSISTLPELFSQSTLGHNIYDIRGSMRGPGGEDHVGCLAVMRLARESDALGQVTARSKAIPRLCEVYRDLKRIEASRGYGIFHGQGVTPKSRRILLNALCRLEILSEGKAGASNLLHNIFHSSLATVASMHGSNSTDALFQITEAVFDLASFPPSIASSLFILSNDPEGRQKKACIEVITSAICDGYCDLSTAKVPSEKCIQWNRLRAAFFYALRHSSAAPDESVSVELLQTFVKIECSAIHVQCAAGPASASSIFTEELVEPESVPAGIWLKLLGDRLNTLVQSNEQSGKTFVSVLHAVRGDVISSFLLPCPEPEPHCFLDPRTSTMEAYLFTVVEVSRGGYSTTEGIHIFNDTMVAIVRLLLFKNLGKTHDERQKEAGLSLDGPQSLAISEFLSSTLKLGSPVLEAMATATAYSISVYFGDSHQHEDIRLCGLGIICSVLFRAANGALPPWAVEKFPEIFKALFFALGKDRSSFERTLAAGLSVRLSPGQHGLHGVSAGGLLAGKVFESLSQHVIDQFIRDASEIARKDDANSWRRMKVLVKQVCGGKKKESDFGQKPALTCWDFERI